MQIASHTALLMQFLSSSVEDQIEVPYSPYSWFPAQKSSKRQIYWALAYNTKNLKKHTHTKFLTFVLASHQSALAMSVPRVGFLPKPVLVHDDFQKVYKIFRVLLSILFPCLSRKKIFAPNSYSLYDSGYIEVYLHLEFRQHK